MITSSAIFSRRPIERRATQHFRRTGAFRLAHYQGIQFRRNNIVTFTSVNSRYAMLILRSVLRFTTIGNAAGGATRHEIRLHRFRHIADRFLVGHGSFVRFILNEFSAYHRFRRRVDRQARFCHFTMRDQ